MHSSNCKFHHFHFFPLLRGELSEEIYLFLRSWFPIIVCFEGALQMGLYIHIEGLGLELRIWWVINTWNRLGRGKMVKVGGQLVELCPCSLLLEL